MDDNIIDRDDLNDFLNVLKLLKGVVIVSDNSKPKTEYFQSGSEEEKSARRSLVKLLRSPKPLPRPIRIFLADLFDDSYENESYRIIKIENFAGNSSDKGGDIQLAKIIYHQHVNLGKPIGKVILDVSAKVSLSKEQVEHIWYKQRDGLFAWYGEKIPRKKTKKVPLSNKTFETGGK
jgi:hypothetical protein